MEHDLWWVPNSHYVMKATKRLHPKGEEEPSFYVPPAKYD